MHLIAKKVKYSKLQICQHDIRILDLFNNQMQLFYGTFIKI